MVLAVQHLVDNNPDPSVEDVDEAIGGNICRCTGYVQIREAVEIAARAARQSVAGESAARESADVGRLL